MTASEDIGAFGKKIQETFEKILEKTAWDIYGGVARRTPVDTGHARGNWRVFVAGNAEERPPFGEVDRKLQRGSLALDELRKIRDFKANAGQAIWIFNNAPYIVPLDEGHSKQNTEGIVDPVLTMIRAQAEEGGA